MDWPKAPTTWIENRTLFVSIPFTWNLPEVQRLLYQGSFFYDKAVVGGPAVQLMPDYPLNAEKLLESINVLQRVNPQATRTTLGCPSKCSYCAIGTGKVEAGEFVELYDWPDQPIICDNNLLAASLQHFDKVIDRLIPHGWADFNQGLDPRLLTHYHAKRIREITRPIVRLAMDGRGEYTAWEKAFMLLKGVGIPNKNIRTYCLIAFKSDPSECWNRCELIESHGVKAYPMWFHELDALKPNKVTAKQKKLGWSDAERKHIMGYYYKHRGNKGPISK